MKKYLLFLLVLMLICFTFACVQASDTELSLTTIGHLFKWSYDNEDVMDILETFDDVELEFVEDADPKYIIAQGESENKFFYYSFYFDTDTDLLSEIECADIFYDDDASLTAAGEVIEAYDLYSVPDYEDTFTASYVEDLDGAMTVAGDKTICILGGKDPSDDFYGYVSLVFLNRAFTE